MWLLVAYSVLWCEFGKNYMLSFDLECIFPPHMPLC
jgi:hypothetical protein